DRHHLPVRELRRLQPARLVRGDRPVAEHQPPLGARRPGRGSRVVIATNVRRLGLYLLLSFAIVSGGLAWWQVVDAQQLATRQDNPLVIAARRSALRGSIFDANGALLASSAVTDGISRRTYVDQALAQVIGYASLRFGTTGVERAWDDVLTGRTDPNPFRNIVNDILARQPQPSDLTLTIDKRLQDFAAAKL